MNGIPSIPLFGLFRATVTSCNGWLKSRPMLLLLAGGFWALAISVHADEPFDSSVPPHPTLISVDYQGATVPVIGAAGKMAQIEVGGKLQAVASDAIFYFKRGKFFAPGRIEIKKQQASSDSLVIEGMPGQIYSRTDMGVDYLAEVTPTLSYKNCYFVIVFFDPKFLAGATDLPLTAWFFKKIGDLKAGRAKTIGINLDAPEVPAGLRRRLGYFVLVFSGKTELRSNVEETPALFFRRLELLDHRRVLADYRAANQGRDRPVMKYLSITPILPDKTDFKVLPETINASLVVTDEGKAARVELRESLPESVSREILRTIRAWLFIPRLEAGVPVDTEIHLAVAIGDSEPDAQSK